MKNILKLLIFIFLLYSCESEEEKKLMAQEVVQSFISNLQFDNYETLYGYYPSFRSVNTYWKVNSININSTTLNSNGTVIIIGEANNKKQLFFELERVKDNYKITNSKGLSSYYDSNLYKFSKNIGCIGLNEYDADINRICNNNKGEFELLVASIKNKIETKTRLENQSLSINGYSTNKYVSGDISIKNYSRFTIPRNTFSIYINYLDSSGNVLYTDDKSLLSYENIPFNQSISTHVFQSVSNNFSNVDIKLKLTNTKFIEELIAEYAEGSLCSYSYNL